jgi:hypothetical protein
MGSCRGVKRSSNTSSCEFLKFFRRSVAACPRRRTAAYMAKVHLQPSVHVQLGAIRLLSTPPPPTDKSPSSSAGPVPPPSAVRKSKVDLRPGPIKTPSSQSSSATAPNGTPTPLASEKLQQVKPAVTPSQEMPQPQPVQGSVLSVMKSDIEDAMRRGVMVPTPADANALQKFWHPLKEVSVSGLHLRDQPFSVLADS